MRLLSSLRGLFRCAPRRRRPCSRRLALEPLEDRLCLSYTVIDLGTLGGASSAAFALNGIGQVVGRSATAGGEEHAFLWQNGAMIDLGTLGGTTSSAHDINDNSQVVGGAFTAVAMVPHAFLWQNGVMTDLGTLGGAESNAYAINGKGQVVGSSQTAAGVNHAFVWENGVMYDLNGLVTTNAGLELTFAIAINGNGQVVGQGLKNGQWRAFLLTDDDGVFGNGGGVVTDLGTLGGAEAEAFGLNGLGQVVGWAHTKQGSPHAFRYSNGAMTDLKTLGGPSSYANAINDAGQVVGTSQFQRNNADGPYHAFLWQNGKMTDLNKQLPAGSKWTLEFANDINKDGHIVGDGLNNGQRHAFLLVPGGSRLRAVSTGTADAVEALTLEQVQPLLSEAVARWQAAGVDTSSLSTADVRVADLPGTTLGQAAGRTLWLDVNAAGWGWFLDPTPSDDSEFTTPGDQGEQQRMDLLTVLMHEVGHLLGHEHDEEGVMQETLAPGTRLLPEAQETAGVLASPGLATELPPAGTPVRGSAARRAAPPSAAALDGYFAAQLDWDAVAVALALSKERT